MGAWTVSDLDIVPRGLHEERLTGGTFGDVKHGELVKTMLEMLNGRYQNGMPYSLALQPHPRYCSFDVKGMPPSSRMIACFCLGFGAVALGLIF